MGEQIERITLQLQADKFAVDIEKQKQHIKDLNYSLKQTDLTLKQRKELIIDKANAEKNLKSLQAELKKTDKELQNVGKSGQKNWALIVTGIGAGILAYNKIKKIVGGWIDAAREDLKVRNQIKAAIESTGNVANVTDKELMKLAGNLAKATGNSKAYVANIEAMLLTFTRLGGDLIPETTEAVLNISKVMNVDAKNSAIQLGKALNDPIKGLTSLTRVGVAFNDEQKKQIKAFMDVNDIASAQKVILKEIELEFGGVARATAGIYSKFGVFIDELEVGLGRMITSVISPFLKGVIDLSEAFHDNGKIITEGLTEYDNLALTIETLSSKTNRSVFEQKEYQKALNIAKRDYPEYLGYLDSEKTSHEDIVKALRQQRDLVKGKLFEQKLQKDTADLVDDEYEIRSKLLEIEKQYNKELSRINPNAENQAVNNIIYQNAADIEQRRQEILRELNNNLEEQSDIEERHKEILNQVNTTHSVAISKEAERQEAIKKTAEELRKKELAEKKATEEETKFYDELTKKVEAYDKARNKANTPKLELKDIEIEQLETQLEVVEGITDAYENLADVQVDLSVSSAEYWDLQLSKAQEFQQKYGEAINQTLNLGTTYNQIETAEVENKYATQKEALDKLRADGLITEDKYKQDLLKLDLKAEKEKKKINERQQKIDIAMATMNMGVAVTNALRTQPFFPLGLIMAGLATAQGLMNIALIKKQKFGRGGMLVGPSHEQGGIVAGNVEFEGGEGVVNKTAMRNPYLRKIVSDINQSTGGVAFSGTRSFMATGGIVSPGISTARMESLLESVNRNIAGLELSVNVNNSAINNIDKITSEVTKRQNKFVNKGGNLAGV